jgi:WhiB family redox-sensing transcriptional regulator
MHEAIPPGPQADVWEWQYQGLCRTRSPELFFHPEGERGAARRTRDKFATALCRECPVIQQCREHALSVPEPYGVWGGLTEHEREVILSKPDRAASA